MSFLLPKGAEDLGGRGDALTEEAAAERLGGRGGPGPQDWRRAGFCSGASEVEGEVEAGRGRGGHGHGGRAGAEEDWMDCAGRTVSATEKQPDRITCIISTLKIFILLKFTCSVSKWIN